CRRRLSLVHQPARPHRPLHSFPTRRSSDLRSSIGCASATAAAFASATRSPLQKSVGRREELASSASSAGSRQMKSPSAPGKTTRSEEHTSELQSQSNVVCRLLLEKKKKNTR